MHKMFIGFLFAFVWCMPFLSAQKQSIKECKKLCAESKLAWEKAKTECGNTYSYQMKQAFMPSQTWQELTVEVVDGKVHQTTLNKYKASKLMSSSTEKVSTFKDNPVGTLDDMYKDVENRVFNYSSKDFEISFSVDKNQLFAYASWENKHVFVTDRATPSYSIYNLKLANAKK